MLTFAPPPLKGDGGDVPVLFLYCSCIVCISIKR